jgi:hypothetical protein
MNLRLLFSWAGELRVDSRISCNAIETKQRNIKKNLQIKQFLTKMGRKTEGLMQIVHAVSLGKRTCHAMPSALVYVETPRRGALEGLHNLCREN